MTRDYYCVVHWNALDNRPDGFHAYSTVKMKARRFADEMINRGYPRIRVIKCKTKPRGVKGIR